MTAPLVLRLASSVLLPVSLLFSLLPQEAPQGRERSGEPARAAASPDWKERTAWLTGVWDSEAPKTAAAAGAVRVHEVWSRAVGDGLLGTSQLYRGDATLHAEFARIRHDGRGGLTLTMRHGLGDDAVHYRYPERPAPAGTLIFENPDYEGERARRIVYRKEGERGLRIDVVHLREGRERTTSFRLLRAG